MRKSKYRQLSKHRVARYALALWASYFSAGSMAFSYGIYDPRSLALGGASVALANTEHAQFYNPALLSFHDGREEDTQDGRIIFPLVVAQVSTEIEDAVETFDDELDEILTDAVEAFNGDQNADNANLVIDAARSLNDAVATYSNKEYSGEAFVGFSVSEPSAREGGSFFFGTRAIGGGSSEVSDEDFELIDDYIEAMEFVATAGASGVAHPELFDGDGNLIDPQSQLTASASVGALVITEAGVAMAKEFEVFGIPYSVGISPKIMRVDVYAEDLAFTDNDVEVDGSKETYLNLNFDVGVAAQFGDHFRIGLAAKDLIPETYAARSGIETELSARVRMGMAYVHPFFNVGMDYDLKANKLLGSENEIQELAFGAEFTPWRTLAFRTGYRIDNAGTRGNVTSFGVGYQLGKLVADLSYAKGDVIAGGALRFAWAF